jgi:hypothetical protein
MKTYEITFRGGHEPVKTSAEFVRFMEPFVSFYRFDDSQNSILIYSCNMQDVFEIKLIE